MTQAEKLKNKINEKQETQVQERPQQDSPLRTVFNKLESLKPSLERALPNHLNADRLVNLAFTTIRRNSALLECTPASLLGATMQAAQVGLQPDALGSCFFVPFWNNKTKQREVQFIIGYKGMIELVRRTGEITSIVANEVYENDDFDFEYGLNETLYHRPKLSGDRGKIKAFYAYARFRDGSFAFSVMGVDDVNQVRDKFSKSKNKEGGIYGPWVDHYESMAKKTVIKQLIKYMPISVDVQNQIVQDETVKSGIDDEPIMILDMEDFSVEEEQQGA